MFETKRYADEGNAVATVLPGICLTDGCGDEQGWRPEHVLAGQDVTAELRHKYALDTLLAPGTESLALLVAGSARCMDMPGAQLSQTLLLEQ